MVDFEARDNQKELVVETINLSRSFGNAVAVKNIDLKIPKGVVFGLLGINGAGKSTLIKMLMGHLQPTSGEVRLFGQPLRREDNQVRQNIGYVSDERYLYEWMTVGECLNFTKVFHVNWDDQKAAELINRFELAPKQKIKQLSRGNRARLCLALALAYNPQLIVLDEPTSGLDPIVRREFIENIISEIGREGATVLFSSHLVEEVERIADHVGIINNGQLLITETVDNLKSSIKRVRLISNGTSAELIKKIPGVVEIKNFGKEQLIVIERFDKSVLEPLKQHGIERLETVPMSLEEIFVSYVNKTTGRRHGEL